MIKNRKTKTWQQKIKEKGKQFNDFNHFKFFILFNSGLGATIIFIKTYKSFEHKSSRHILGEIIDYIMSSVISELNTLHMDTIIKIQFSNCNKLYMHYQIILINSALTNDIYRIAYLFKLRSNLASQLSFNT